MLNWLVIILVAFTGGAVAVVAHGTELTVSPGLPEDDRVIVDSINLISPFGEMVDRACAVALLLLWLSVHAYTALRVARAYKREFGRSTVIYDLPYRQAMLVPERRS